MGYKIIRKEILNPTVTLMEIEAPFVAAKAKAGEFIILRVDEVGERIPLTIADYDRVKGTITIIFQIVGLSTQKLNELNCGDMIMDFVGPLGKATHIDGVKKALVIGGGVGAAIAYPICKALKLQGSYVDAICGFRNKDIVILEDEFKSYSDHLYMYTDDGSYGTKGFVTSNLAEILKNDYDEVFVIGPLMMMKNVVAVTKEYGTKTTVSMNSIMIDGTGMCGGCKLYIDGKLQFACVDGPDFDGFKVDFDSMILKSRMYRDEERHKYEAHCNLLKEAK